MTRLPRVYAAHSKVTYWTEHEAHCLDALGVIFAGWEVFNPAGRYRTDAGWLRAWPRLLSTLDALVLFADETGCVGVGCMREVTDAIFAGVVLYCLDADRRLCELVALDLLPPLDRTRTACARPVAGDWGGSNERERRKLRKQAQHADADNASNGLLSAITDAVA